MAVIVAMRGQEILVDDGDIDGLAGYNWRLDSRGYPCRSTWDGGYYVMFMHRQLMGLERGDKRVVDHINGNKADNRRQNLRICYNDENLLNSGAHKDNLTGFKGVTLDTRRGTYQAKIQYKKRQKWLGAFETPELAHEFYCLAADLLHGEFANHGDRHGKDC